MVPGRKWPRSSSRVLLPRGRTALLRKTPPIRVVSPALNGGPFSALRYGTRVAGPRPSRHSHPTVRRRADCAGQLVRLPIRRRPKSCFFRVRPSTRPRCGYKRLASHASPQVGLRVRTPSCQRSAMARWRHSASSTDLVRALYPPAFVPLIRST